MRPEKGLQQDGVRRLGSLLHQPTTTQFLTIILNYRLHYKGILTQKSRSFKFLQTC